MLWGVGEYGGILSILIETLRLVEDTYTANEVSDILDGLCAIVKQDVQKELLNTCHCNVLLLRQFFVQAEKIFLDLPVDTNELENQYVKHQLNQCTNSQKLWSVRLC